MSLHLLERTKVFSDGGRDTRTKEVKAVFSHGGGDGRAGDLSEAAFIRALIPFARKTGPLSKRK